MISIGLVCGPRSSNLEEQCSSVMELFERERTGKSDDGLVNVVFHSPLSLKKADHEGMIIGAFSRKDKKVLVAIAVPQAVIEYNESETLKYINESLHEAADHGLSFMASKEMHLNAEAFHRFIDETFKKVSN